MLCASGAVARSYNCADPSSRPEGKWSLDANISQQVVADIASRGLGAPRHFKYRMCGSMENGQLIVLIGAFEIIDGAPACDSEEDFAVFYDPRNRMFGEVIPGVNLCVPAAPARAQ